MRMVASLLLVAAVVARHDIIAGTVRQIGDQAVVRTKSASSDPPVKLTHNLEPSMRIRSACLHIVHPKVKCVVADCAYRH